LRQALRADPKDARAWHELGTLYFNARRYSEMLPAFEKVLELMPKDENLRNWLKIWKKGE
jgi:cytochrome c-type biogenesis protein CcmH/NrfG